MKNLKKVRAKPANKTTKKKSLNDLNFKKTNSEFNIVFPSSPCDKSEIVLIKKLLAQKRLNGKFFLEEKTSIIRKKADEFSPSAVKDRFLQLQNAILDQKTKVIWCARGGYGSAELLPFLYQMPKPKKPKLIIGFSDISAIATFFIQEWNWQVLSAPMLFQIALNRVSKHSQNTIFNLINGKISELNYQLDLLSGPRKEVSGEIVGGCMSVISSSFGTKNQLDWNQKILFLEDIDETAQRLDRYFTQIVMIVNETKKQPSAILLGNFLESGSKTKANVRDIKKAIAFFGAKLPKISIWQETTGCLGHSPKMMPILIGGKAKIIPQNHSNEPLILGILKQEIHLNN